MDIISTHPIPATLNVGEDSAVARIRLAQSGLKSNRREALAALNEIFRSRIPPDPQLAGAYPGELVALDIAPGLTLLVEWIASTWMPWKGKTFDPLGATGDNLFTRDSLFLAHVFWPFYRYYINNASEPYS